MVHGTTLIGLILPPNIIIAAESRLTSELIEGIKQDKATIVYQYDKPGVMRYATEDYRKVMPVASDLVGGFCGSKHDAEHLLNHLSDKIKRRLRQKKTRPHVKICASIVADYARTLEDDGVILDFGILLGGFDNKVPQLYYVFSVEGAPKDKRIQYKDYSGEQIVYEGTGGSAAKKYLESIPWYDKNFPPRYISDKVSEAIQYAGMEMKDCGGLVRSYIITEKKIECVKYTTKKSLHEVGKPVTGATNFDEGFTYDESWKIVEENH